MTLPEFQKGGPATWVWVIGPLILYLLERLYRYYMSKARRLSILKVRPSLTTLPGHEVQVMVPKLTGVGFPLGHQAQGCGTSDGDTVPKGAH